MINSQQTQFLTGKYLLTKEMLGKEAKNLLIFHSEVQKYKTADFLLRVLGEGHQSARGKPS